MSLRDRAKKKGSIEKNKYLDQPKLGMQLISNLLEVKKLNSSVENRFKEIKRLVDKEYMNLSVKSDLKNEAQTSQMLNNSKKDLEDMIKFPFLVNKQEVAVGGAFSAGKSSFVNSLLKDGILPTDTTPTTSIPTYIANGNDNNLFAHNVFGKKVEIDQDAVQAISHAFNKEYDLGFTRILKNIILQLESFPYDNITFLDTPGYTKSETDDQDDNTDKNVAKDHLKRADYLIWLIDIENGTIKEEDIRFLKELDFDNPILFIFNKADMKQPHQIKEIIKIAEENIINAGLFNSKKEFKVIAYSSIEEKEYFSNELDRFLTKINMKEKDVDVLNDFKKAFKIYFDHHEKEIREAENDKGKLKVRLANQNEFILKNSKNMSPDEANLREELIKELKIRINKKKDVIDENNSLLKDFADLRDELEEKVKDLLEELNLTYSDIEVLNKKFLECIKKYKTKTAVELINKGINVNIKNKEGLTPIFLSILTGQLDLTEKLIKSGARLDERVDINYKANVSGEEIEIKEENITPLLLLLKIENNKIYKRWKEFDMDISYKKNNEVMFKVKNSDNILASMEFNSVESITEENDISLYKIVSSKKHSIVKLMLENGADANEKDNKGIAPIIIARHYSKILSLLIENGADINARNEDGETALIMLAGYSKNIESIKVLIEAGCEINIQDNSGETALIKAADFFTDNYNVVKLLIESGAKLNKQNNEGNTALIKAIFSYSDNNNIIKLLIESGTALNIQNNEGQTALIKASLPMQSNPEAVKLLIDAGADLDIQDNVGETALMNTVGFGCNGDNYKVAKLLIEAGADVNIKNNDGLTALDKSQDKKMINLLKKHSAKGDDSTFKEKTSQLNSMGRSIRKIFGDN